MTVTQMKPNRSMKKSKLAKTFCEFFAGIGLVREGLEASRWHCIYANDNDPKKEEQYSTRFRDDGHFHLGDVCNTDAVMNRIDGSPFLATVSFPCVDLSLAGHWEGLKGEHSSTFFSVADVLASLGRRKPKLLMLENVKGLLSSHQGKDFTSIVQTLAELGYWMDAFVIDAKHFVPQSRPRIFIIGVHSSLTMAQWPKSSKRRMFDPWTEALEATRGIRPDMLVNLMQGIELPTGWIATGIKVPPTNPGALREQIDFDENQEWWDKHQVEKHYKMMSDPHRALVDKLMKTDDVHVGTIYRRTRNGKTRAEVRFDGLAGCLRTPRGGSARQIVIVIDSGKLKIRWMNPREYSRLQGAGNYPLVGGTNQQLFGFGDAVCVPVIEWIDKHVLTPAYEASTL